MKAMIQPFQSINSPDAHGKFLKGSVQWMETNRFFSDCETWSIWRF